MEMITQKQKTFLLDLVNNFISKYQHDIERLKEAYNDLGFIPQNGFNFATKLGFALYIKNNIDNLDKEFASYAIELFKRAWTYPFVTSFNGKTVDLREKYPELRKRIFDYLYQFLSSK